MPWALAAAYIEALPRLQAQENLNAVLVGQLAAGLGTQSERRRVIADWTRLARIDDRQPAPNPAAMVAQLAAMGVPVEEAD